MLEHKPICDLCVWAYVSVSVCLYACYYEFKHNLSPKHAEYLALLENP